MPEVSQSLPTVSVSIITYNQRDLIGRAIDSVLMQEVNFPYEIIIGDDCSSDGTQEVLREYRDRHPDKIQLILHPRRYTGEIPGRTNNTTNLLNCRAKYTAMLDGDDYWTEPDKLQRQYDRMESQPELSMCLHDARMAYTGPPAPGEKRLRLMSEELGGTATGIYTHADLARRDRMHPFIGSVMYRTAFLRELPEWFYEIVAADYALLLHLSRRGPVYYDERPAAAYYISPQGFQRVYRKDPDILRQELRDIDIYAREFPVTRTSQRLIRRKATLNWYLSQYHRKRQQWKLAAYYLSGMFRCDPKFGTRMMFNPLRKLRDQYLLKEDDKNAELVKQTNAVRQ